MRGLARVDGLGRARALPSLVKTPVSDVAEKTGKYLGLMSDERGKLFHGLRYRKLERHGPVVRAGSDDRGRGAFPLFGDGWKALAGGGLDFKVISSGTAQPPKLAHGLQRVLRAPNKVFPVVGQMGEKRYFTEFFDRVPHPQEIDWSAIPPFCPAGLDRSLHELAKNTAGVRFKSSTSSTTAALSAVFHVLSSYDTVKLKGLSTWCSKESSKFTRINYKPAIVSLVRKDGVYSIDKVSGRPPENPVLMNLGHALERMLTYSPSDFRKNLLVQDGKQRQSSNEDQAFNYTQLGSFLLRAQLDCMNEDTGEVFDLKSRAVAPVRWNLGEYENHLGYAISAAKGQMNSFEREFYDMVRSCLIKYSMQVRIGRMSGVFVTYHNTRTIFGFEYLSLAEMDRFVFGNSFWADLAFDRSFQMLEKVLKTCIGHFPESDCLRVILVPEQSRHLLHIYVQRCPEGPTVYNYDWAERYARFSEKGRPDWDDIGMSKTDICRYQLRVTTLVNGEKLTKGQGPVEGDDVQVHYKLEQTELGSAKTFLQNALRGFDIDEMPRK